MNVFISFLWSQILLNKWNNNVVQEQTFFLMFRRLKGDQKWNKSVNYWQILIWYIMWSYLVLKTLSIDQGESIGYWLFECLVFWLEKQQCSCQEPSVPWQLSKCEQAVSYITQRRIILINIMELCTLSITMMQKWITTFCWGRTSTSHSEILND